MALIPRYDRSEYFWPLRVSLFPCSGAFLIEADKYCALTFTLIALEKRPVGLRHCSSPVMRHISRSVAGHPVREM
jgi:hypothetical protein